MDLPHLRAVPSIAQIAQVLLLAPPEVPWANEGGVRHILRRTLLIVGWSRSWRRCDREARRLVANGRLQAKIRMPSGWEWLRAPSSWGSDNPECPICGKWTPRKYQVDRCYCSDACAWRGRTIRRGLDLGTIQIRCSQCYEILVDPVPTQEFCSARCRNKAQTSRRWQRQKDARPERPCAWCGAPIPGDVSANTRYCCSDHQHLGEFARRRERRAAERVAEDLEAPRYCASQRCGKPLPVGAPIAQKYCDNICNNHAYRDRKKANGHDDAHGPATADRPGHASCGNGHLQDQAGARQGDQGEPGADLLAGAPVGAVAVGGAGPGGDH